MISNRDATMNGWRNRSNRLLENLRSTKAWKADLMIRTRGGDSIGGTAYWPMPDTWLHGCPSSLASSINQKATLFRMVPLLLLRDSVYRKIQDSRSDLPLPRSDPPLPLQIPHRGGDPWSPASASPVGCIEDFHFQVGTPCRAHQQKSEVMSMASLALLTKRNLFVPRRVMITSEL